VINHRLDDEKTSVLRTGIKRIDRSVGQEERTHADGDVVGVHLVGFTICGDQTKKLHRVLQERSVEGRKLLDDGGERLNPLCFIVDLPDGRKLIEEVESEERIREFAEKQLKDSCHRMIVES